MYDMDFATVVSLSMKTGEFSFFELMNSNTLPNTAKLVANIEPAIALRVSKNTASSPRTNS